MSEENKSERKQSYESDGLMGKDKEDTSDKRKRKQDDPMFFNTTPSSE